MAGLVLAYYWLLRSALRAREGRHRCLSRCRHCGIFFLADPRNAGRRDLGCPFGCQEAHRKRESTRRSVEYYRGDAGQAKKRLQNSRRCRVAGQVAGRERVMVAVEEPGRGEPPQEFRPAGPVVRAQRSRWGEPVVEYVRLLCSFIEGRRVGRDEVVEMLGEVWRQRGMARLRKIDHVVSQLNHDPP